MIYHPTDLPLGLEDPRGPDVHRAWCAAAAPASRRGAWDFQRKRQKTTPKNQGVGFKPGFNGIEWHLDLLGFSGI